MEKRHHRRWIAPAVFLVALGWTSPAMALGETVAAPAGPVDAAVASTDQVTLAVTIGPRLVTIERGLTEAVAAAVITATDANGAEIPVLTGTVLRHGGAQDYQPGPDQWLRVEQPDGTFLEVTVAVFDVDWSRGSVAGILAAPHTIVYGALHPDGTGAIVDRTFGETSSGIAVAGQLVLDGAPMWVDVTLDAGYVLDIAGNVDLLVDQHVMGTLQRHDLAMTIDETSTFRFVRVDTPVETRLRSLYARWAVDGVEYSVGFTSRRVWADGVPVELDAWIAEGAVRRAGEPIGFAALERSAAAVDTVLVLGPERVVVYHDPVG